MNEAAAEIAFAIFLQGNTMNPLQRMPGGLIGASMGDDTAAGIRYLAFMDTALDFRSWYEQVPGSVSKPSL